MKKLSPPQLIVTNNKIVPKKMVMAILGCLTSGFLAGASQYVSAEEYSFERFPLEMKLDGKHYDVTEDLRSDSLYDRKGSGMLIGGLYLGITSQASSLTLSGKSIDVDIQDLGTLGSTKSSVRIFQSNNGNTLNLGGENTDIIRINVTGKPSGSSSAMITGLSAMGATTEEGLGGGILNVDSKSLEINIAPEGDVISYAVFAQGGDLTKPKGPKITLNSNTKIKVSGAGGHGIVALSLGSVDVLGDLYLQAKEGTAITTRGQGAVTINSAANKTVQIDGNIDFNYDGKTSGTKNDGQVSIILSNENSFWNGNATHSFASVAAPADPGSHDNALQSVKSQLTGSNLSLTISNGAVWNPDSIRLEENTNDTMWDATYYAPVSALSLDGGVVNVQDNGQPVIVRKLEGNGTVNIVTNKTENGFSAGQFVVGNAKEELSADKVEGVAVEGAAKDSNLTVNFKGITSDEINSEEFKSLSQQVQALGANQTQIVAEGVINGELQQTIGTDGNLVSTRTSENTVNQSLRDIGAMTFLGFRTAINDLDKRLGDLRSYSGENGGWVRYLGGQNRYGARNMKLNYNGFQAGFDHRFGEFYAGVAFGYTKGNGHLRNGSSDNNNWNFGLYGGWLGEKGQFVDVIVKRHRFKNEFNLHNTSGLLSGGSYHNWATSFSAEAGWRFSCPTTGFYAEPQAELSFGRMESGSFTTSQGVRVKQNSINSTVGRLGIAAGYALPDNKGNAYLKASVLHDWSAKVKGSMSKGTLKQSYRDDLSGTWAEFSVGGTYNATKNISAYGEFQTSAGSPVRSPWAASIGVRYNF